MTVRKYPKRPLTHEIGDRAARVFQEQVPRKWVINRSESDYGWDFRVNIVDGEEVREEFSVQLKGTDKPKFILNQSAISQSLKVRTINHLLERNGPSMICVCHTSEDEEPIYWVWLNEAIKEIDTTTPNWHQQETVSLRIPTSQVLSTDGLAKIQSDVKERYTELKIEQQIGELVGIGLGVHDRATLRTYRNEPERFMTESVVPSLRDAGIIDVIEEGDKEKIESLSSEDRERYRKLSLVSSAIKIFHDKEAKRILDELASGISAASDGIKARYFNSLGILALHSDDYETALSKIKKALKLRPQNKNYATNMLLVEELLFSNAETESNRTKRWIKKLDEIIDKTPDYIQAQRLKTRWIAKTKGVQDAETYLRSLNLTGDEQVESLAHLADICLHIDEIDRAIELLDEAEALGGKLDAIFHALHGYAILRKVLQHSIAQDSFIRGFGPPSLDIELLVRSKQSLSKALKQYASVGYPHISETALINYACVSVLLNSIEEAERACLNYLDQNLDSPAICSALASCLSRRGEFIEAQYYARIAYEANPESKREFKTLALMLYGNEAYEELIDIISIRAKSGFVDADEEGLARELLAISYSEIGEDKLSQEQIEYMQFNDQLELKALLAQSAIERKRGKSTSEINELFKAKFEKYQENEEFLSFYVQNLFPITSENAKEITLILRKISGLRQLHPEEFSALGNAYLKLNDPDQACGIYKTAINRYPSNLTFKLELANAYVESGDEDSAFLVLEEYFKTGAKSYEVIRNLGILAFNIGKLDRAINLFQRALSKTTDQSEQGLIHCQLWEFKRRRKDNTKQILYHAMEFGKTILDSVEDEARFIMMCLMSSFLIKHEDLDEEVNEWFVEIRKRTEEFTNKYPKYIGLTKFSLREDVPDEDKGMHLLADLYSVMLPHHLRKVPLQMSVRSIPFPLAIRAKLLNQASSVFDFWEICTKSKDFSHAIHIWRDSNNLEVEQQNAKKISWVCMDLSSILTLLELNLLQIFTNLTERIIISHGTKLALEEALYDPFRLPNSLAQRIEKWRLDNRKKIRMRSIKSSSESKVKIEERNDNKNRIIVEEKRFFDVKELISDGFGETLMLAHELGIPLYSDESLIREWAQKEYGISTFSTLNFIFRLAEEAKLSRHSETVYLSSLIDKNFRIVPFAAYHLHIRLKEMISIKIRNDDYSLKSEDLKGDEVLGVFLNQFADLSFKSDLLYTIIIQWWVNILGDENLKRDMKESDINNLLCETMIYPSFCLSNRTESGIIIGIDVSEPLDRIAALWALFLWKVYTLNGHNTLRAWSAIKSTCEQLYKTKESHYNKILFRFVPKWLAKIIENDSKLSDNQKLMSLVSLPQEFSDEDRDRFERLYQKNPPPFMK